MSFVIFVVAFLRGFFFVKTIGSVGCVCVRIHCDLEKNARLKDFAVRVVRQECTSGAPGSDGWTQRLRRGARQEEQGQRERAQRRAGDAAASRMQQRTQLDGQVSRARRCRGVRLLPCVRACVCVRVVPCSLCELLPIAVLVRLPRPFAAAQGARCVEGRRRLEGRFRRDAARPCRLWQSHQLRSRACGRQRQHGRDRQRRRHGAGMCAERLMVECCALRSLIDNVAT